MLSNLSEPSRFPISQPPVPTKSPSGPYLQVSNSSSVFRPAKCKTRAIEIKRVVRQVRGRSQARLVAGRDGRFYVAKFTGNPQGNRTLANEWIARGIMSHLSISTPPPQLLRLPESLRSEGIYFQVGNRRIPVEGEWHLGSLCPVNPETKVILDFLPRSFWGKVSNLNDFAKILIVDRGLYQVDQRQAVFARELTVSPRQRRFRAYFIDHGMAFAGSAWALREGSKHALYMDRNVYSLVNMPEICEETVAQIEALTRGQTFSALETLPDSWLSSSDRKDLHRLVEHFHMKRSTLRCTIRNQIASLGLNVQHQMEKKGMGCAGRQAKSPYRSTSTADASASLSRTCIS